MSSKVIDQCYVTIKGRRIKNTKKQKTALSQIRTRADRFESKD